jgi:hypothetical protein
MKKLKFRNFFCEMMTTLEYKCVNKQTRWVRVRRVFKVWNFRTRTSDKSADSDSDMDVRKALRICVWYPCPSLGKTPIYSVVGYCESWWNGCVALIDLWVMFCNTLVILSARHQYSIVVRSIVDRHDFYVGCFQIRSWLPDNLYFGCQYTQYQEISLLLWVVVS